MVLEKWRPWSCLMQGCHKSSIYKTKQNNVRYIEIYLHIVLWDCKHIPGRPPEPGHLEPAVTEIWAPDEQRSSSMAYIGEWSRAEEQRQDGTSSLGGDQLCRPLNVCQTWSLPFLLNLSGKQRTLLHTKNSELFHRPPCVR